MKYFLGLLFYHVFLIFNLDLNAQTSDLVISPEKLSFLEDCKKDENLSLFLVLQEKVDKEKGVKDSSCELVYDHLQSVEDIFLHQNNLKNLNLLNHFKSIKSINVQVATMFDSLELHLSKLKEFRYNGWSGDYGVALDSKDFKGRPKLDILIDSKELKTLILLGANAQKITLNTEKLEYIDVQDNPFLVFLDLSAQKQLKSVLIWSSGLMEYGLKLPTYFSYDSVAGFKGKKISISQKL